jgi:hypothetical protein
MGRGEEEEEAKYIHVLRLVLGRFTKNRARAIPIRSKCSDSNLNRVFGLHLEYQNRERKIGKR